MKSEAQGDNNIKRLEETNKRFRINNLNNMLDGYTAVVTGCSSGIGAAITSILLEQGAYVIGCYNESADALSNFQPKIIDNLSNKFNERFRVLNLDLADRETPSRLSRFIQDTGTGELRVLCNVAGIAPFNTLENISREEYLRTFDVNLNGHVFLTKLTTETMKLNDPINGSRGSIVNLSSVAGEEFGEEGTFSYGLTKGAIHSFTMGLAVELGKHGIRANSIAPGSIITPMNHRDLNEKSRKKGIEDRTALRRWGHANEVAYTALFLASPMSSYITGTKIIVDGGLTGTFEL